MKTDPLDVEPRRVSKLENAMKDNSTGAPAPIGSHCESCGSSATHVTIEREQFPYGAGPERVELQAQFAVVHCLECGESFAAVGSEDARHAAVCRHLGRLTPDDLRGIRGRYGLSQQAFASLTGFGPASIKRWESGALIQSESADKFVRLLEFPENMRRLKCTTAQVAASTSHEHVFRTTISEASRKRAAVFRLSARYPVDNQVTI